jgi:hypothetical protein
MSAIASPTGHLKISLQLYNKIAENGYLIIIRAIKAQNLLNRITLRGHVQRGGSYYG